MKLIEAHNNRDPPPSYTMGVNSRSDFSEEFLTARCHRPKSTVTCGVRVAKTTRRQSTGAQRVR